MKYRTPYRHRQHAAKRYREDAEFRLRKVNYSRVRRGKEPLESVEQIRTTA